MVTHLALGGACVDRGFSEIMPARGFRKVLQNDTGPPGRDGLSPLPLRPLSEVKKSRSSVSVRLVVQSHEPSGTNLLFGMEV